MSEYLFASALGVFLQIGAIVVGALVVGGLLAGLLQGAVRVRDNSEAVLFKLGALGLLLWFAASPIGGTVGAFAERLWGGSDFYDHE